VSVDYFVDSSRAADYVYDRLSARVSSSPLCWYSWLIIATWPLFAVSSAVIQFCVTGAKFDHREQPQSMFYQCYFACLIEGHVFVITTAIQF